MKKMMFTLIAMLTIAASANAMSYEQARNEALFLTDKMAYELNLSDAQYEAAYEINLDYLMGVTSQYDVFGPYWERRNLDLSYILFSWQWDLFRAATYFYRPLFWDAGYWHFGIYARYPHRDYFYFGRPHFYVTYRGGHSWRMNNGHSFYEGRRDFYRPGNPGRDQHFGMRSGWDRGDYRNNHGGHQSSTHITGNRNPDNHGGNGIGGGRNGGGNDGRPQGGFGSGRNGNNNSGNPDLGNRRPIGGSQTQQGNTDINNNMHQGSHGNFGGNRSNSGNDNGGLRQGGNTSVGNTIGGGGNARTGGSFGGNSNRSGGSNVGGGSTRTGGSFGGNSNRSGGSNVSGGSNHGGGSTRSGGSFGGGSRSSGGSNSHGSFGGSRR